jgi:SNF2 family DNA or RNA helicase
VELSLSERLRLLLAVPLESLLPGKGAVLEWPGPLYPFQAEGVRALIERPRVLLADDMGLGKTIQAIAAIRILCWRREVESVLVIVRASLIDQWRREVARWAPELRLLPVRGPAHERAWQWRAEAHIKLVGYETFRQDSQAGDHAYARAQDWDLVVIDEAQQIKNRETGTSREVKRLRRKRSWALTGTPLENSAADLVSILEFVDHTDDGAPRQFSFDERLRARHRELQIRRRKQDVLKDLPRKQVITLRISLSPGQQESYDRAEQEGVVQLRALGESVRIEHILTLILRLKQLCNADPRTGESAKLADIAERMAELSAEGNRALVFSQFTDDVFGTGAASRALADFEPLVYTGGFSAGERDAIIASFTRDIRHKVLVLSLKAGGVGLNLQEASYVFHLDRWWNPAIERQAEDRSHRMGQPVPVTVFKYTCTGTIEERIEQILAEKRALFDELVDDVSADIGARMNQGELFGLFGMEPPAGGAGRGQRPDGLALEERCARLLASLGWRVERTPVTRDGGVDLIARRSDELGIEQELHVQCKDHARPASVEVVRALLGVLPPGSHVRGVVASPAGVTPDAAALAQLRGVAIWDEQALARLETEAPSQ